MTGDASTGVTPRLDAEDLIRAVPGLDLVAEVTAESFLRLPGAHLRLEHLIQVAEHIGELAHRVDGVVITQGTDTIEETSFALDLLTALDIPIVVTGAMRNPQAAGADGAANLLAAVTVASDPEARGRGVLVVLNEQVHAARYVAKTHTSRPDAFRSPDAGAMGDITESRVRWFWKPPSRITIGSVRPPFPRVPILTTWLGDDGTTLDAVLDTRPDGLVLQAMGAGHVPEPLIAPLESAARRIPVVLTSRTGSGRGYRQTYGFPGSEMDLLDRGLLWGGGLAAAKLRLLLTLGLAAGWDPARLEQAVGTLG